LVRLMVELGINELGSAGFCAKLHYIDLSNTTTADIMKKLLTCVYQATENSSKTTQRAAITLAKNLGADYHELHINRLVRGYLDTVSKALKQDFTWQEHDIPLQNIQARARAPSVWLIANLRHALLLATSNRSEIAMGYATMDGDTAGSLAPLGGIDKDFIRQWLRWLEHQGPVELEPISALSLVNQQQPTAELRPAELSQTDEADLMPYDLLNAIEKAAIRDRQTPYEIYLRLHSRFDYAEMQLVLWIERFFTLWARNQWKRERYAPSFHLDDENLDSRSWCRFPILSGGFERELQELRDKVQWHS
jgi:NAD+ synthase (glutamine-hydrolysing)